VLSGLPKSKISIVSPEGETRSTHNAVVSRNLVVIDDPKAIVVAGDEIHRALPNGQVEVFDVIDPAYYEGHGPITAHYQVKISRKGLRQASQAVHNTFNVSGPNSRVNFQSHDASTNTVAVENTFQAIRDCVTQNVAESDLRDRLLSLVERMEAEKNKSGFAKAYADFISCAANHIAILTPLLPALMQFMPS
jgi:hypothetical protein